MFTDRQKEEIQSVLNGIPNVRYWGIGKKYTNRVDTNVNAIIVIVTNKRDVEESSLVPTSILGIPTDITEDNVEYFDLNINPDYSYSRCTVCDEELPLGQDSVQCTCTQCGGDDCPNPCLTNRVAQVYDNVLHDNHNGRILQGGLSGLGKTWSGAPCSSPEGLGMCTFSLVAQDNVDNKLVLLGNQHCLRPQGILGLSHVLFSPTYSNFVTYQNNRLNNNQVISNIQSATYMNPSNYDGCAAPITTKNVGEFKAVPFIPNAGTMLPANMAWVNISSSIVGSPIPNGLYNMQSYDTSESGLNCLQREFINTSNDYIVTFQNNPLANTNNKVAECGSSDAIIYTTYVTSPIDTTIIPLPGIHDLGEGPFEWMTREDFNELLTLGNPIYAYKSGARRGVHTDIEEVKYIMTTQVSIGSSLTYTEGLRFIPQSLPPDNVMHGGGDSGSPVLVEHDGKLKILGLFTWGGCATSPLPGSFVYNGCVSGTCYAITVCPIWRIAEDLNIRAWDGSVIVDSSDMNITIAGRPYLRTIATTQPITHYKD